MLASGKELAFRSLLLVGIAMDCYVPEADVSRVKEEDTAADFTSRHYLWIMGFHMF